MYTTKPLSLVKRHPAGASEETPEGPYSGYLVVKDAEDRKWSRWRPVEDLPFPQNCVLRLEYIANNSHGEKQMYDDLVMFVPVPDQPLASSHYYAVVATGKHKGLVRTCSREEDRFLCCFCCPIVRDVEPRPFDPADVYQQMKIVPSILRGRFKAEAVANDGIPYKMYRKFWRVYASAENLEVGEALGLDAALRSRLLSFASLLDGFPTVAVRTAVGKWYCPFFLVKEHGMAPPEQMDRGMFYEVTLEQRWETVHSKAVRDARGGSTLASKKALIGGSVEAEQETGISPHGDSYVWFTAALGQRVAVCSILWQRMLWEEHRTGWVDKEENAGRVAGGSVLLVERFAIKRMNGRVVVAFDFVRLDKIRAKQV